MIRPPEPVFAALTASLTMADLLSDPPVFVRVAEPEFAGTEIRPPMRVWYQMPASDDAVLLFGTGQPCGAGREAVE